MKKLTRSLGHLSFVTDGLYRPNREPEVKAHGGIDEFEVMVMTSLQRLEFRSRTLANDPLVDVLARGRGLLQELMEPLRFSGWKECFDYNLSAPDIVSARHWKWSGDVKETGVDSARRRGTSRPIAWE